MRRVAQPVIAQHTFLIPVIFPSGTKLSGDHVSAKKTRCALIRQAPEPGNNMVWTGVLDALAVDVDPEAASSIQLPHTALSANPDERV